MILIQFSCSKYLYEWNIVMDQRIFSHLMSKKVLFCVLKIMRHNIWWVSSPQLYDLGIFISTFIISKLGQIITICLLLNVEERVWRECVVQVIGKDPFLQYYFVFNPIQLKPFAECFFGLLFGANFGRAIFASKVNV